MLAWDLDTLPTTLEFQMFYLHVNKVLYNLAPQQNIFFLGIIFTGDKFVWVKFFPDGRKKKCGRYFASQLQYVVLA